MVHCLLRLHQNGDFLLSESTNAVQWRERKREVGGGLLPPIGEGGK
ncbi:hypothetical protein Dd586_1847 [Dickeya parazeae Ech586]|uniref:Uncharacterized protein n=1 Tax=Dickeya zeae (strain Ech586) TaxID=590409 RepID=D2BZ12_DICZ5|nr:hypothetical protein Dd586_1847 [Dickeya parazeae Ech586]